MSIYSMTQNIKKLILKHSYLSLEHEDIKNTCSSVEKEMRTYIQQNFPEYVNVIFNGKTETETEKDKPPKEPPHKDCKTLYRKIASITHPDKDINSLYTEIFRSSSKAYKNNNFGKLLEHASTLNINLDFLSESSVPLLKENISTLEEYIEETKKTAAYVWSEAKNEEEKLHILNQIISHYPQPTGG